MFMTTTIFGRSICPNVISLDFSFGYDFTYEVSYTVSYLVIDHSHSHVIVYDQICAKTVINAEI